MPVGIVTGASRGLGLALARELAKRDWTLVVDARGAEALQSAAAGLNGVVPVPGDVSDAEHRRALVEAAGARIDLVVNNASLLGPSPQPGLADYPLDELARVYEVNVFAPLALVQLALPRLASNAAIVHVTSDAAVDPGDMRTQMQQDAFPGEDISDRPPPEESVPGLLALVEGSLPSGRYQARELG